jgi:hypothetical protein
MLASWTDFNATLKFALASEILSTEYFGCGPLNCLLSLY